MTLEEKLRRVRDDLDRMYNAGADIGYKTGYDHGKRDGSAEGARAEYDRFWDNYQDNGNREHYTYAFSGLGWKKEIFKPKYDIIPSVCGSMFYRTNMKIDMVDLLETQGIVLDLSKSENVSSLCNNAYFTRLGIINTTSAPDLSAIFSSCIFLEEVLGLVLKDDGSQKFSASSFQSCSKLIRMPVSGVIGQNGFDIHWSTGLSKASLESIVNAASTTASITITLSSVAVKREFETSAGANDGNTSQEWKDLVATRPTVTFALA